MKTILFFDADERLRAFVRQNKIKGNRPVFFNAGINATPDADLKQYRDVDIISLFTHAEAVDNKKLTLFKNLKMLNTRSTGFNHIDLAYCKKRNIVVTNVPHYGETTVAEFAFGLLLALVRKIIAAKNDMAQNRVDMAQYMGFDLHGKTLGVIGTGSIGRHMIQIAQGFGMNIAAYDPYPTPALKGLYVQSLKALLERSDIITLHVPSTPQTRHMLDTKAFAAMKPGMIVINTARGDLIDTQALRGAARWARGWRGPGRVGKRGFSDE